MPTSGFKVEKVPWLVHSDPWQGTQPAMITRTPLCLCRDKDVLVHFLYWVDTALVKLDLIYHHLHKFREIVMKTWILWWNIQQNPHFFQASGYVINGFKSQTPLLWNSNSKRPFFIKGKKFTFSFNFRQVWFQTLLEAQLSERAFENFQAWCDTFAKQETCFDKSGDIYVRKGKWWSHDQHTDRPCFTNIRKHICIVQLSAFLWERDTAD